MNATPEMLRRRAWMLREIREFFRARGFLEVETDVRIAAPAPEPHIDCPPSGRMYLRASPELQMKRLLAAGSGPIFQIGPCFREGEKGSRHREEFTMLEWYRPNSDASAIRRDLEELFAALAAGASVDCPPSFRTIAVRDAYRDFAGWDPWTDWDQDRFDYDMAVKIEPSLPGGPVFLSGYPRQAASLARLDGDTAERWEFYFDGMELANAFTELTDGAEQRRRFEAARAERAALGESDYPLDESFLAALAAMPPSGGVALGIDRLAMVLFGAKSIDEVRFT